MIYLTTLDRKDESKGLTLTLTREKMAGLRNLPDLCPSRRLVSKYRSGGISWDEFCQAYLEELREEYKKPKGKIKGLVEYSLDKDVTLMVPDDDYHIGYLNMLGDALDKILRNIGSRQRTQRSLPDREINHPAVPDQPEESQQQPDMLLIPTLPEKTEKPMKELPSETPIPPPFNRIESLAREAPECEFYSPHVERGEPGEELNCFFCEYFDGKIFACMKKNFLFVEYQWEE